MIEEFTAMTALVEGADTGEPTERARALHDLLDSLQSLVTDVKLRLVEAERERETGSVEAQVAIMRLRETATARDEAIEAGTLTEQEADEAGVFSHLDLDWLAEEGLLEAVALGA